MRHVGIPPGQFLKSLRFFGFKLCELYASERPITLQNSLASACSQYRSSEMVCCSCFQFKQSYLDSTQRTVAETWSDACPACPCQTILCIMLRTLVQGRWLWHRFKNAQNRTIQQRETWYSNMKVTAVEKRCQFDGIYVILIMIMMIMTYDIILNIGLNMVGWTHTVQDCLTVMSALRSSGAYRRRHRPSMNVRECVFVSHFKPLRFFSQSFWKSSPAVVENATKLIETNPFLNSVGSNIRATALCNHRLVLFDSMKFHEHIMYMWFQWT